MRTLLGIQGEGAKSRRSFQVRAEPSVERPIPETVMQHIVEAVHLHDVSISITIQLARGKFSARHIRDDAELPFRGIHRRQHAGTKKERPAQPRCELPSARASPDSIHVKYPLTLPTPNNFSAKPASPIGWRPRSQSRAANRASLFSRWKGRASSTA